MEPKFDNILIFATNIKEEYDRHRIAPILENNPDIQKWSIDLEDIDCVLRVESNTLSANDLTKILRNHNFECTELE